jgi:8-amino-7-oxononanoate synthase
MGKTIDRLCGDFLADYRERGLLREMKTVDGPQGRVIKADGRECVSFASNNYLGLANHPEVVAAAAQALDTYGLGSGASRLIVGNMRSHEELETAIARFKGREAAAVYPSGYSANVGVIPALAGEGDVIFSDASNHSSIIDGSRLSRARRVIYRHLDADDLRQKLRDTSCKGRRLIVTDTVFSIEGDVAPLDEIVRLAEEFDAMTMIDEAHATGTLGERGRGGEEHFGVTGRVDVVMGTLSKALGSQGGFTASDAILREFQVNASRTFIYSTALAPAAAAGALAAIRLLEEDPSFVERLRKNVRRVRAGIAKLGLPLPKDETHIILIVVGGENEAVGAAAHFLEYGILVPAVRYPTVPRGKAAFRLTVSTEHTSKDIDRFLDLFTNAVNKGLFK